jgi:hypothetical protein
MSGQFDGDGPFSKSMQALPAFFGGSPPWHLWGNTQQISTTVVLPAGVSGLPANPGVGQLVKVSYKRPTSWNWIFSSKLILGPNGNSPSEDVIVTVDFELTLGVGRSFIQMQPAYDLLGTVITPPFEQHSFQYGTQFPANAQIWSTKTTSPSRTFIKDTHAAPPAADPPTLIDTIIGQDIQIVARVLATCKAPNFVLGSNMVVEVSAQLSPVVHVRPDWFRDEGDESRFGGNEIGGT